MVLIVEVYVTQLQLDIIVSIEKKVNLRVLMYSKSAKKKKQSVYHRQTEQVNLLQKLPKSPI